MRKLCNMPRILCLYLILLFGKFLPNKHKASYYRIWLPFIGALNVRLTKSDKERVIEYLKQIYLSKSYLYKALKRAKPTVVIDIGANIGLSSLYLSNHFDSLIHAIGVEADQLNYEILKKNYKLWSSFPKKKFTALNAVASPSDDDVMVSDLSLNSIDKRFSASGSLRFKPSNQSSKSTILSVSLNQIIKKYSLSSERLFIKIDIEGGESYLFSKNYNWIKSVYCIAIEFHDHFDPSLVNSSKPFFKAILNYNFAIEVGKDTVFFYNRTLLKEFI